MKARAAPADSPPLSPSQPAVIAPQHPRDTDDSSDEGKPEGSRGHGMHTRVDHFRIRGPQLWQETPPKLWSYLAYFHR